jgi:hypothetical protein
MAFLMILTYAATAQARELLLDSQGTVIGEVVPNSFYLAPNYPFVRATITLPNEDVVTLVAHNRSSGDTNNSGWEPGDLAVEDPNSSDEATAPVIVFENANCTGTPYFVLSRQQQPGYFVALSLSVPNRLAIYQVGSEVFIQNQSQLNPLHTFRNDEPGFSIEEHPCFGPLDTSGNFIFEGTEVYVFPELKPPYLVSRQAASACPAPPTDCGDGIDNDGDGFIDFPADAQCSSIDDVTETLETPPPPPPACGLGPELALLLAPLWWARRRRS